MKTIKEWGWLITLTMFFVTGVFGYGILNERVNNNTLAIHKHQREYNRLIRELKNDIVCIRESQAKTRDDLQEIKGYLRGKNGYTKLTR